MSPTVTIAVLPGGPRHGRLSSAVLGTVILGDLVLVALVIVGIAVARLVIDGRFDVSGAASALPDRGRLLPGDPDRHRHRNGVCGLSRYIRQQFCSLSWRSSRRHRVPASCRRDAVRVHHRGVRGPEPVGAGPRHGALARADQPAHVRRVLHDASGPARSRRRRPVRRRGRVDRHAPGGLASSSSAAPCPTSSALPRSSGMGSGRRCSPAASISCWPRWWRRQSRAGSRLPNGHRRERARRHRDRPAES